MDLTRWGILKISRLTKKYRNLQDFLGQVLEGERTLVEAPASGATEVKFTVRNDIDKLFLPVAKKASGPEGHLERLAPYFEAGFLLQVKIERGGHAPTHHLKNMFLFGHSFEPSEAQDGMRVDLKLPIIARDNVIWGRVRPVLAAFGLESISSLNGADAFAMSPKPGWVFVLVCNRPYPWQLDVIEKAYKYLSESLQKGPPR